MPEETRNIPAREYEEAIKRVRDVITARIVLNDSGGIDEIHVLAGPGRAVKYIARDIESSIIAAFGVTVDRRTISIAQLSTSDGPRQEKRVRLEKVEIISEVDSAQVNVHLKMAGTQVSGSCRGVPTVKSWLYLAAGAAVSAMSQFLSSDISFHVEDVSVSSSRPSNVALVSIVLSWSGQQQLLTGSCPVTHDEREAVVKAVLDALNRRFGQLLATD